MSNKKELKHILWQTQLERGGNSPLLSFPYIHNLITQDVALHLKSNMLFQKSEGHYMFRSNKARVKRVAVLDIS